MILESLFLQNFRNYRKQDFKFEKKLNVVVGANASGKSNLIEAILFLSRGKSGRTESDAQLICYGQIFCRVKGLAGFGDKDQDNDSLEVLINTDNTHGFGKKYLVNGVSKRRADFAGRISTVAFSPLDLEIVIGGPSNRRRFLDEALEQASFEYRAAVIIYAKALRQRNALLEQVQKTGKRNERLFIYWDDLLIKNGNIITEARERLIEAVNSHAKDLFQFRLEYDRSAISKDRLKQYEQAERGAGVTLVGPHRDDILIFNHEELPVKYFSSRGQQRLVVLELKLSQISYLKGKTGDNPLLLLDDIFSELDDNHIQHVLERVGRCQTIITTTHEDFVSRNLSGELKMIKLSDT